MLVDWQLHFRLVCLKVRLRVEEVLRLWVTLRLKLGPTLKKHLYRGWVFTEHI